LHVLLCDRVTILFSSYTVNYRMMYVGHTVNHTAGWDLWLSSA